MKTTTIKTSILSLLALLFIGNVAFSQYDDLYYEASDEVYFADIEEEYIAENKEDVGYSSFDEDDGYFYTSRIRRFSRPSSSISYFSPIYTNSFYYDRYSPFGFNSVFGPTRANAFSYNNFGNPFVNPVTRNRFGGINNSIGRVGGAGFSSAYYCPPVGGFANARPVTTNNNNNVSGRSAVNSSRRSGTVSSSTPSRNGSTRTVRTSRDYRGSSSTRSTVRTDRTRSTSRTTSSNYRTSTRNNRSFSSPRTSSTRRSTSTRSSAPRSSSSRSSSRGSRG